MTELAILDTSVIIDFLRGYDPAIEFLQDFPQPTITDVTHAELIEGCRDKGELEQINGLVSSFQVLPVTREVSRHAVRLLQVYYLSHGLLFDDALIAAAALHHQAVLLTTETKHFRPIKGLKSEKPY